MSGRKAFDYMPGVPAAGHVTAGGWWHPGRAHGCVKCAGCCEARHPDDPGCRCQREEEHPGRHHAGRVEWEDT